MEDPTSPNDHYRQGDIECIDAIPLLLVIGATWWDGRRK